MKCLSCGTHIPDESLDCPHCKVAQTNTKTVDHAPLTPQVQSTQPYAYYEQDTPVSGTLPANAPAYIPSPPSSFSKKKLLAILIAGGGIAAVVFASLVAFLFFNIYTTLQSYTRPVTMSNSTQLSLNPYIKRKETLALSDPLQNNSLGNLHNYHWMDDPHDGDPGSAATKGCYFVGQNYHVSTSGQNSQDAIVYCLTLRARFSNFTYQVQMSIQQGHFGGIIFRQSPGAHFYAFVISNAGDYILFSNSGSDSTLLAKGTSNSINQQSGMFNLLAVVANGNQLDLYVNQHHIASVTDSTYSVGIIGMIAMGDDKSQSADMAYHDAKVWVNSK